MSPEGEERFPCNTPTYRAQITVWWRVPEEMTALLKLKLLSLLTAIPGLILAVADGEANNVQF